MIMSKNTFLEPRSSDVLCGRGGNGGMLHCGPGNTMFRTLVAMNKVRNGLIIRKIIFDIIFQRKFALCESKKDKRKISSAIVETIYSHNGRFLEWNEESSQWQETDEAKAYQKTSQALRENQQAYREESPNIEKCEEVETIDDDEIKSLIGFFFSEVFQEKEAQHKFEASVKENAGLDIVSDQEADFLIETFCSEENEMNFMRN